MGAVQDRSTLTVAQVREELGISTDISDARLAGWLDEALEAADVYLNNPFLDRAWDGQYVTPPVPLPIPLGIYRGVYEWIGWRYQLSGAAGGRVPYGVTSEGVGDLSRGYDSRAVVDRDVGEAAARKHWSRFRLEPGFGIPEPSRGV